MTQQPQHQPYAQQPVPEAPNERVLAVLSHLSSLLGLVASVGTLSFLGPLIFWFVYRDRPEYAFVRTCSAGAFNFNLMLWLVNIAAGILAVVTLGIGLIAAVPIWGVTSLAAIIFHIIGAVQAHHGEVFRYPLQIRVLR